MAMLCLCSEGYHLFDRGEKNSLNLLFQVVIGGLSNSLFQEKVAFHVQTKGGGKMWKLLGGASDFAFYSGVQQWVLGNVGRRVFIFS